MAGFVARTLQLVSALSGVKRSIVPMSVQQQLGTPIDVDRLHDYALRRPLLAGLS